MTRNRVPVFSGEEAFPDKYANGFQTCYEAMRAVCKHVIHLSSGKMLCVYIERTRQRGYCVHRDYSQCAPHFSTCRRLFRPVFKDWPPPRDTK